MLLLGNQSNTLLTEAMRLDLRLRGFYRRRVLVFAQSMALVIPRPTEDIWFVELNTKSSLRNPSTSREFVTTLPRLLLGFLHCLRKFRIRILYRNKTSLRSRGPLQ